MDLEKVKRVKLFESNNIRELERIINRFLEDEFYTDIDLIEYKTDSNATLYNAIIVYRTLIEVRY